MPGDIIGTNIIVEDAEARKHFQFQRGPIFGHILLADEVNRATPKTQSALLEGMQEGIVTVSGHSHPLPQPFFVLATQNPIEMEGTYPLPEAQLDRFLFKLRVRYPALEELTEIIDRTTHVREVEVRRVMTGAAGAARCGSWCARSRSPLTCGISLPTSCSPPTRSGSGLPSRPAGSSATARARAAPRPWCSAPRCARSPEGRFNVSVEDLRAIALPALRHRLILNFEGEAEGVDVDDLIRTARRGRRGDEPVRRKRSSCR